MRPAARDRPNRVLALGSAAVLAMFVPSDDQLGVVEGPVGLPRNRYTMPVLLPAGLL